MLRPLVLAVMILFVACGEQLPCLTKGASREFDCECPPGTLYTQKAGSTEAECLENSVGGDADEPNESGERIDASTRDAAQTVPRARDAASISEPTADTGVADAAGQSAETPDAETPDAAQADGKTDAATSPEVDAGQDLEPHVVDAGQPKPSCQPNGPEICDGLDNDCNGKVDDSADLAKKGQPCSVSTGVCKADGVWECNDAKSIACSAVAKVKASDTDACDGLDNDCDGMIDEDPPTWYADCDGDGFATLAGSMKSCGAPSESGCARWISARPTSATTDCDDAQALRYPGAQPIKNDAMIVVADAPSFSGDTNCNGTVEKDTSFGWSADGAPEVVFATVDQMPRCTGFEVCGETMRSCARMIMPTHSEPDLTLPCGISSVEIWSRHTCAKFLATTRRYCW
jgi:hypothetical protein